ncbi:MAG: tetratricopeptide repeat protein [Sterolibacterium sp.]|jgi:hypothetical protein|nr:tetratricopeptide repeat protein [Sterolibacterium sp.]
MDERSWGRRLPLAISCFALAAVLATLAQPVMAQSTPDHELDAPQAGRDYYAIQLATSSSQAVLERQFARYAWLPYVRIEQRGTWYVLRAGFWGTEEAARAAAAARADVLGASPLVRLATYRPEMTRKGNWPDVPASATSSALLVSPVSGAKPLAEVLPPAASPALRQMVVAPVVVEKQPARVHEPQPPSAPVAHDKPGMKPYDAEDYALAFDAFLGSGDRERAFLVASKAVASVPADLEWRRKLARVAEWTQRPAVAWTQWSALFRQGDRTAETQTAMLRLAPFFDEPGAAIEVWKDRIQGAGGQRLNDAQWQDLYNLYESSSQPRAGTLFFEQQYRRLGKPKLLEYAAQQAENLGDDDRALSLFIERARLQPYSQDAGLHAATILLRRDREREAYALLESQRARAPAEAEAYWSLLTNIALNLAELKTAEEAMRRLDGAAKNANNENAGNDVNADWARLIAMLRLQHPARAADLSLELYRRTNQPSYFLAALEFYTQTSQRAMQERLLAALSPAARVAFEKDARFLRLRARYYQTGHGKNEQDDQNNLARAWADLQQALRLQPEEREGVVSVLWFLLDQHRLTELEPLLHRYAAEAEKEPAYWLVYASAYHELDQYRKALPWYRKEIERSPDDTLLLLNYADLLERLQQPGMAERLRRHAWLTLREKFPQPTLAAPLDAQPELLALARLSLQNHPGDPGMALVRKLVTELRGLSATPAVGEVVAPAEPAEPVDMTEPVADQQTRDLVLGWAISHELHPEARAWMWLSQARSQARNQTTQGSYRAPLWGAAQTALQLNDTQRLDKLLLTQEKALPIYNRYDIAQALEHWPQAQGIAFNGMRENDVDEELHDRYRQHVPRHLNHVQWRTTQATYGALDSREQRADAHLVVSRRLHLDLGWERFAEASREATLATPARERLARVGVQWLGSRGDTTLTLFQRNEQTIRTGWRATQGWMWDKRWSFSGMAAYRGEATDSLPLRVQGYQNSLSLGAGYALSRREYVAATQRFSRYYTQFDDALGSSRTLDAEAGYRIRLEYPDWRARLFATTQSLSYRDSRSVGPRAVAALAPGVQSAIATGALDAVRYFLPQGSTTVGACLGMGENLGGQNLQEVYTRAWRPFYDACTSHNSVNGAGYSGYIGMAGSVDGEDHLAVRLEQSSGGTGAGALSRVLSARYRHYF